MEEWYPQKAEQVWLNDCTVQYSMDSHQRRDTRRSLPCISNQTSH